MKQFLLAALVVISTVANADSNTPDYYATDPYMYKHLSGSQYQQQFRDQIDQTKGPLTAQQAVTINQLNLIHAQAVAKHKARIDMNQTSINCVQPRTSDEDYLCRQFYRDVPGTKYYKAPHMYRSAKIKVIKNDPEAVIQ